MPLLFPDSILAATLTLHHRGRESRKGGEAIMGPSDGRYDLTESEWGVIRTLLSNKLRGVPRVDAAFRMAFLGPAVRGVPCCHVPRRYGPYTICLQSLPMLDESWIRDSWIDVTISAPVVTAQLQFQTPWCGMLRHVRRPPCTEFKSRSLGMASWLGSGSSTINPQRGPLASCGRWFLRRGDRDRAPALLRSHRAGIGPLHRWSLRCRTTWNLRKSAPGTSPAR